MKVSGNDMTSVALNYENTVLSPVDGSLVKYSPQLLINNPLKNENILSSVIEELTHCQSFMFIVAFVTESGLATLKSYLLDLKGRGIRGRLLTSTYLYFNNPKVFRELLKIENMDVRLTDLKGFHSKGYIFNKDADHALIIGSANLTVQALKINYEWNVKLKLNPQDEFLLQIRSQFEEVWNGANILTEEWILNYEKIFVEFTARNIMNEELTNIVENNNQVILDTIEPNKMQLSALENIKAVRLASHKRALVISATGTGKTYLSAFDVRSFNPKRLLFIAHREQILLKAKSDYMNVVGGIDQDYGMLSSTGKNIQAKYLFATIQTISKSDVLSQFDPKAFDYILIDEVHKAGASSYRKVIEYFNPQFMLGMTATPERSDDFNIYQLFDYNVAYEIRLQAALEEDMLCPFHYFGVTDLEMNGETIDDSSILSKLVNDERVVHLIGKIEYYGFSGVKVKGLIFCSRKDEAIKLSAMFNEKGYRTIALTGDDAIEIREKQIRALEKGALDYIITVDIFNEGIDIPSVNQVVMLRQTQSSIIFIQQLGRGLRKHADKEFVTIIDFIGNYKNNYLIPIALSGDKSMNKDNIRRIMKDSSYINGVSTINFEEIAKEQIYKSITNNNLTELRKLKEAFHELKNRIGHRPTLHDFITNESIDPIVIVNSVKPHKNYYQFLITINEDIPELTSYEQQVLTMLSSEILDGKRIHEIILLELLFPNGQVAYDDYVTTLEQLNCRTDPNTLSSVIRVMDLSFFVAAQRKKYGDTPICILKDGGFYLNDDVRRNLETNETFKEMFLDVILCAKEKTRVFDSSTSLTLYQKYTRKDACKLLNWESDESSTIYGYKTKYNTCPIFVTYHKHDEVESSINYGDEFLSPSIFKWYTRSNRKLQSEEVKLIIAAVDNNIDIHIFVKKDDDEGGDFYYLGEANPDLTSVNQTFMQGKDNKEVPVVCMDMILKNPVEQKLYEYIKMNLDY
ncbi:NgoFVII family restriction endonuclease [Paenibacillus antarcticus]|uniref:NgoFVII family restriction endonuclease n=1 Tax=Paenibacillus antarcticus TaxID=253703 RepID=A0A168QQ38_9BACL|nr:NgoFVII family restriction endonuclease [Paenibacillus antarcticus]